MKFTDGQTYFFIFCMACVCIAFIQACVEVYRMHRSTCYSCKALQREVKRLDEKIAAVKMMAITVHQMIQRRSTDAG